MQFFLRLLILTIGSDFRIMMIITMIISDNNNKQSDDDHVFSGAYPHEFVHVMCLAGPLGTTCNRGWW